MNEPANVQTMFSDITVDVLRSFPGAKLAALNKPLFCSHCDKGLSQEYDRLYLTPAPMAELIVLLKKRRGEIVRRIWPDNGRQDWMCHTCGREVRVV
jgi:hypothetical protein